jgi:hypothetical protein
MELLDLSSEVIQQIAQTLSVNDIINLCGNPILNQKLCDGPFLRKLAKEYLTNYELDDEETNKLISSFSKLIEYESSMFGEIMYNTLINKLTKKDLPLLNKDEFEDLIVPSSPSSPSSVKEEGSRRELGKEEGFRRELGNEEGFRRELGNEKGKFKKLKTETWYSYDFLARYLAVSLSLVKHSFTTNLQKVIGDVGALIDTTMAKYIEFLIEYGYEKRLIEFLFFIEPQIYSFPFFVSIRVGLEKPNPQINENEQPYDQEDELNINYIWQLSPVQYAWYVATKFELDYLINLLIKHFGAEEKLKYIRDPLSQFTGDELDITLRQFLAATEEYFRSL